MWISLEICRSLQHRKYYTNRLRIDKAIAMVRLARFFLTHSVVSAQCDCC